MLFQNNARTAISVGQASGLALVAAARAGVPVTQYSPNEVKLAVTGDGRADKLAVQTMITRLLGLREVPRPADAADALALACCHVWRAPARRAGGSMIGSVRGTVIERSATGEALVEVGGVGYRVLVPVSAVPSLPPGAPAFLFTHLHVREDAMVLYGFPTRDERDTFEALIAASGVGPKLALADLVGAHPDGVAPQPRRGRSRRAHAGAGRRQADRAAPARRAEEPARSPRPRSRRRAGTERGRAREVREALTGLGYSSDEVREAIGQLPETGEVEELLRGALRLLAGAR